MTLIFNIPVWVIQLIKWVGLFGIIALVLVFTIISCYLLLQARLRTQEVWSKMVVIYYIGLHPEKIKVESRLLTRNCIKSFLKEENKNLDNEADGLISLIQSFKQLNELKKQ